MTTLINPYFNFLNFKLDNSALQTRDQFKVASSKVLEVLQSSSRKSVDILVEYDKIDSFLEIMDLKLTEYAKTNNNNRICISIGD